MTKPGTRDHDVVILGGGPAGCATAITLARRAALRTLVIEAGAYATERIGESIPPDTSALFAELNIHAAFLAEGHEPCFGSCSSWGSDDLGFNDFIVNPYGHGWHLDRCRFDAFLAEQARRLGVELRAGVRFTGEVAVEAGRLRLGLSDGSDIAARFAVDATGYRGLLARRMGAARRELDRLVAVSASFVRDDATPLGRFTMLEAVEYGWWYAARLPGDRVVAAVATSPALLGATGLRDEERWLDRLAATRHAGPMLARCDFIPGSLRAWPIPSFVLDNPVGASWIAVGDAASTFDPISSQGIYKAIAGGIQAAVAIAAALEGDAGPLAAYRSELSLRFAEYAAARSYFYGLERRWESAPFWAERRARSG